MAKAKSEKKPEKMYQLKIVLVDAPLPIWRRIVIGADMPLELVHEIFQIVMGWANSHLHSFRLGDRVITDSNTASDEEIANDLEYEDESEYLLSDLLKAPGDHLTYEYDWGDCWEHEVLLEDIQTPEQDSLFLARCIAGKRACPPEDVGGVAGYLRFVNAIEDPLNEEHQDMLNWVGCDFDPDSFDARHVNWRIFDMEEEVLQSFAKLLADKKQKDNSRNKKSTLSVVK
jgi:hypothetical protein